MEDTSRISSFVASISEEELIIVNDIIQERLQTDYAARLAKFPDLANAEFSVFDNRKIDKVTDKVMDIRRRRYIAFVHYYSHPDRTDDQMIQFIQLSNFDISYIEAMRDLSSIKLVIGNMPRARKELIRYQVSEMHKKAYQKALENNNEMGMTTAAANFAKANNLDKDDMEIPWDQMIPPAFEPTDDISVIGRLRLPEKELDAKIDKLKARYDPDITDAEEVI
jgi:hypothetical protein